MTEDVMGKMVDDLVPAIKQDADRRMVRLVKDRGIDLGTASGARITALYLEALQATIGLVMEALHRKEIQFGKEADDEEFAWAAADKAFPGTKGGE